MIAGNLKLGDLYFSAFFVPHFIESLDERLCNLCKIMPVLFFILFRPCSSQMQRSQPICICEMRELGVISQRRQLWDQPVQSALLSSRGGSGSVGGVYELQVKIICRIQSEEVGNG